MKIVGRERLDAFSKKHADARNWIRSWLSETEGVDWKTPQELKKRYASASFLSGNRVVFNVKGNDYRLEVVVAYKTGVVSVRWIGTHAEYDQRNGKG
jgi:mRNA interferase HigB